MKITRQKHAKKILSFYRHNFHFREPFQFLLDGTFCQAALKNKIQIKEQLPKYMMGEVQLCTTNCVLKELESLGKELYGAKIIAQRFQVRHCAHYKSPISGSACLLSLIGENNSHHYFIATQDHSLGEKVKKRAGVPLMFIIQNTMVLDKPSPKSVEHVKAVQAGQLVPEHQKHSIEHLKEEQGVSQATERKGKKRKRGGPNPLSCMKKKKTEPKPTTPAPEQRRKRKRNRGKRNKPSANPTTETA